MRKIEREMLTAVANGRDWRSANTSVDNTDHGIVVRLHGNKIAQLDGDKMYITPAGWLTPTTKSRLNALLSQFTYCARIHAKNFEWFLSTSDNIDQEMFSDSVATVSIK